MGTPSDNITSAAASAPARDQRSDVSWMLVGSALLAAQTSTASGKMLYVTPMVGLLVAWTARHAATRPGFGLPPPDPADEGIPPKPRRAHARLALVLILVHVALLLGVLNVAREYYLTNAATAEHLQSIGHGLRMYHDEHGFYPASLAELVLDGTVTAKQIASQYDPNVRWPQAPDWMVYTSFALRPAPMSWPADPNLVVLHDRAPFSRIRERLTRARGRFVLFADGHTQALSEEDFSAAMHADTTRRAELGWLQAYCNPDAQARSMPLRAPTPESQP